jgi:acyl transferase domain-containing protein
MLAVGLSKVQTQRYLEKVSTHFGSLELIVACINSPKNVTISGSEVQIEVLKALLDDEKIFARKLQVNVAYHSFQMCEIASQYKAYIGNLEATHHPGKAPLMVSSVTGTWASKAELSQSDYWVRNMVSPVQFAGALAELCSQSIKDRTKKIDGSHRRSILIHNLLEIGPHSALQGPSKDILRGINQDKHIAYFSMLVRNVSAINTTLEVAGRLYCIGYPINMSAVNGEAFMKSPKRPKTLCDLPEYPFNHARSYWRESRISKNIRFRRFGRLDLLGVPDPDWNPLEAKWKNIIKVPEVPWVKEHKVGKCAVGRDLPPLSLSPLLSLSCVICKHRLSKLFTDQQHHTLPSSRYVGDGNRSSKAVGGYWSSCHGFQY